jgi:hypothetical protein
MLNITVYALFEVAKLEVPLTTKNTILDDPQSQQVFSCIMRRLCLLAKLIYSIMLLLVLINFQLNQNDILRLVHVQIYIYL